MSLMTQFVTRVYAILLLAYPPSFRAEFGDEMKEVFADAVDEATECGGMARVGFLLRELRDWLRTLPVEHWLNIRERGHWRIMSGGSENSRVQDIIRRRYFMSMVEPVGDQHAVEKREATTAALPPLLFGLGIAVSAAIVGGPYRDLPDWRVALSLLALLAPGAAIAIGCLVALVRRLPGWGYTWLGACLSGTLFLANVVGEELADSGRNPVSEQAEVIAGIVLLLVLLAVLAAVATRGWEKAGLVSIGLSSTLGIALWGAVTWSPFHRYDLALLAAPVGLLVAALIYAYVRQALATQIVALLGVCLLNVASVLVAGQVWHEWLAERGEFAPVVPFVVVTTGLLLAGPIVGLLVQLVRPSRHRLGHA